MSTLAAILANNITAPLSFGDPSAGREVLQALQVEPRVVSACIYTRDGKVFARYARGGSAATFYSQRVRENGNYFETDRLLQYREIKLGGEILETLFIESDLTELNQRLTNYSAVLGLVMVASLLLAYLLASRLQKLISHPVLELVRTAGRISSGK